MQRLFGRAPRYGELLGLFEAAGRNVERATAVVAELMQRWPDDAGLRREMLDLEHDGDRITHDIMHHLHKRAVTPFDRNDALTLASGIDDVVDYAEEAADLLGLYNVEAPMEQAQQLAGVLRDCGRELAAALATLDRLAGVRPHVREINRLENEGDRISRAGVASLFAGGIDPVLIIRWKDVFERLEQAIDSCERVAHTLEGIVVKQA